MAPPAGMTTYEQRRLDNIKRNEQMLAALNIPIQPVNPSAPAHRRPRAEIKSYKSSPDKKNQKQSTPVVIRRSLRSLGLPPDAASAAGVDDDLHYAPPSKALTLPPVDKSGVISLREAHDSGADDKFLVDVVLGMSESAPLRAPKVCAGGFDVESLVLTEENVARIVPSRIFSVQFFPSLDRTAVVVGDKKGNVGFWDVDFDWEEGNGIYTYTPHSAPVSQVAIHPFSRHKIFTSSYDGLLRLMDAGEERFDVIHTFDDAIFSFSQQYHDPQTLLLGVGQGEFKMWDLRARKISRSASLHSRRINSIDTCPSNTNLIATSSTDGLACIWDLRTTRSSMPKSLKVIQHQQAVHSAYFSPSGNYLATTSVDNRVGLVTGIDFADVQMLNHPNNTSHWISTFRGIWGWDDSWVFIGNVTRGVDAISTADKRTISLESEHISAIPCRFAAHPCKVGMLAGTTAGGQVYLWTRNK